MDRLGAMGHPSNARVLQSVLRHAAVGECAVVGLEDELKGAVPLALCVLKKGEEKGERRRARCPRRRLTSRLCRRREAEPRGDRQPDRPAGEGHGGTRGRAEESAVCAGVAQDALGQDPSRVSRQPGQRESLQGRTDARRAARPGGRRLIPASPQVSPTIEEPEVFGELEREVERALGRRQG